MPLATRRPAPTLRPNVPAPKKAAPVATPRLRQRSHALDIPFAMRSLAQQEGAVWNPKAKTFFYFGDTVPPLLQPFAAQEHSWEKLKEDELNGIEVQDSPPQKAVQLRPHQVDSAKAILRAVQAGRSGFLNADDVGLGKTLATLAAVLRMPDVDTVLIVCPLAVVAHWRRSIAWLGNRGKRFVVINYDRLKKLYDVPAAVAEKASSRRGKRKKPRKVKTQKGIARYGDAYEFDLIVWDESHKLRNIETARSALARGLSKHADFELWLSATAGQNPLELAYLAPILAESTGSRTSDLKDFELWCQSQGIGVTRGAYGKWSWRGNSKDPKEREGSDDDLERIRVMLFEGTVPVGIRRSPSDIAGWPEINRTLLPVALEAEDRALYNQAWGEFRRELDLEAQGNPNPQNALAVRLRFRQKASLLRTAATVDLATELLEQGLQVAISVAFRETMDIIREALEKDGYTVALIHGSMGGPEKERQRLEFQNGRAQVCIYTVEEGISLHEGEYVERDAKRANIVHDLRWSAIQMKQIEGRTHRDGKFSQVYWMLGENTVEEGIAEVVANRVRSMSKMQGDRGTTEDIEKLLTAMAA